MRVLVTGVTGFVGGRVARHLQRRGDRVIALTRRPAPELEAHGIDVQLGVLAQLEASACAGVDAVIHAAAVAGPDLPTAREVNTRGTRGLASAALDAGVERFVHVSTTSVYDLDAIGDVEVREDAPLATGATDRNPTGSAPSAYNVTKAEAEGEIAAAAARGLSATILRPPAVLGAGPTSTWGTRVPRRIRDGEPVPLHPTTTFGWVHVDDLVDAVLAAMDAPVTTTTNVVGGHVPASRYLEAVHALFPDAPPLQPGDRRWRGTYAVDRLPEVLGVRPQRDLATAMEEIARAWRDGDPGTPGD